MKRLAIVGHRGVGKTQLLKRIEKYLQSTCLDLDAYIAKKYKKSITRIFEEVGEEGFRKIERESLDQIGHEYKNEKFLVVALGAGFCGKLPTGWKCLWLRRESDSEGRIFLDRPDLDAGDSLQSYRKRFAEREARYHSIADQVFTMREGEEMCNIAESSFFRSDLENMGGVITLHPWHLKRDRFDFWKNWGLGYFELRSDLLTKKQILLIQKEFKKKKLLYAYRGGDLSSIDLHCFQERDWDLDCGEPPLDFSATIYSRHRLKSGESLGEFFDSLGKESIQKLKAAPVIQNFEELKLGHRWKMEDPQRRVFLPRSPGNFTREKNSWTWYRLLQKSFPLNFVREGVSGVEDQPTLMEWLNFDSSFENFAAVLGSPISHSRSPVEQGPYWKKRGANFLRIELKKEECTEANFNFLEGLGMVAAAVTSPLKKNAASLKKVKTDEEAINTLLRKEDGEWIGANTDKKALAAVSKKLSGPIAVWGGGGLLNSLKQSLPQASFYSSREGKLREMAPSEEIQENFESLVWAAGNRSSKWPPRWPLKQVVDLDYRENSQGKAFAKERGLGYVSGLEMFQRQAEEQRKVWDAGQ